MPPIQVVHDSGRRQLKMIREKKGGLIITNEGRYKLLPMFTAKRDSSQLEFDNPVEANPTETKKVESLRQIYEDYYLDYSTWNSKRSQLVGLNMPFFVGYSGKACLLNPEALALYEAAEMSVNIEGKMSFNPNELKGEELKGKPSARNAVQPLMPLDPRVIKEIINEGFDETQIAAIQTDSEMLGQLGRGYGKLIPIAVILIIVVVVAVVAMNFLG